METIHPNDISDVDKDSISLITLKNGNMIMIDDSVPEKPKTEKKQTNTEIPKKVSKPQTLSVSNHLTVSFDGKGNINDKNLNKFNSKNIKEKKIFVKSDFNLLSKVIKNTNFSFYGKPNTNIKNYKIENTPITKFNGNNNKMNNIDFSKSLNNFSPILSSNTINKNNMNPNFNPNLLLNDKLKTNEYNENTISLNKNTNSNINDENKENDEDGDDIDAKLKKKSRNYQERLDQIEERYKHSVKAVISLNIPSDNPTIISATQKQFDKLVAQLRQKQHKQWKRNKENITHQRYYELYKDKNDRIFNGLLGPNINRIKYYQEAEAEDLEYEVHLNGNTNDALLKSSLNNNSIIVNNTINNNYYNGFNNKNIKTNKSINYNLGSGSNDFNVNKSINSFYGNKTRASSENKLLKSGFGYNDALVYPTNKFGKRLDFKFL